MAIIAIFWQIGSDWHTIMLVEEAQKRREKRDEPERAQGSQGGVQSPLLPCPSASLPSYLNLPARSNRRNSMIKASRRART
jgi:hypothetical protein